MGSEKFFTNIEPTFRTSRREQIAILGRWAKELEDGEMHRLQIEQR